MKKKLTALFLALVMCMTMSVPTSALSIVPESPYTSNREMGYEEIVEYLLAEEGASTVSPNWTSGTVADDGSYLTHGFITETALDVLTNKNSDADSFFTARCMNQLKLGSVKPDFDETDNGFAWHFYGENGKNYLGGTTTAYSKFIEHYNDAVDRYDESNSTAVWDSMLILGRALHYLQDLNVPHHASNAIAVETNHLQFEALAERNMESYAITSVTSSYLTTISRQALGTTADNSAEYARDWYTEATSLIESTNLEAVEATLKHAQKDTAGILYKFMIDVGAI